MYSFDIFIEGKPTNFIVVFLGVYMSLLDDEDIANVHVRRRDAPTDVSSIRKLPDEVADRVGELFKLFLLEYVPLLLNAVRYHTWLNSFQTVEDEIQCYRIQIENMFLEDRTTIYVDFRHLNEYNRELADLIQLEHYRYPAFNIFSMGC